MASKCRTAPIEWFVEMGKGMFAYPGQISVSCASTTGTNCPATWRNLHAPSQLRIFGLPDNPPVGWVLRNPDKIIPLRILGLKLMLYAWCIWSKVFLWNWRNIVLNLFTFLFPWQFKSDTAIYDTDGLTFHLEYSHLFLTLPSLTEIQYITYYSLLQAVDES